MFQQGGDPAPPLDRCPPLTRSPNDRMRGDLGAAGRPGAPRWSEASPPALPPAPPYTWEIPGGLGVGAMPLKFLSKAPGI